jgi:hypothetical protein
MLNDSKKPDPYCIQEINSSILKRIRGNGYSKMLALISNSVPESPLLVNRPRSSISTLSNKISVPAKKVKQTPSYKLKLVSSTSPSFPRKALKILEVNKNSQVAETFIHRPAYFPKRSLNTMIKKYSNFKTNLSTMNEDSMNISRLVGSPTKFNPRKIRYTHDSKFFAKGPKNHSLVSSSSSDLWGSIEPRNITMEYLI